MSKTGRDDSKTPGEDLFDDVGVSDEIQELNEYEFNDGSIIKVRNHVWVANCYAISNIVFIEAPEGVVVVDATETEASAAKALSCWRRESGITKPITDIIFTHHHSDHTAGSPGLVEDPAHPPEVWAHVTLPTEEDQYFSAVGAAAPRAVNQFGGKLPPEVHAGCGIGPKLLEGGMERLPVTRYITESRETHTIAGLDEGFEFLHSPGETGDQVMIWVPEYNLLCPGDNFYHSFPNIYTIRGSVARDARKWSAAVDVMRSLRPMYLAGSHSLPLEGADHIYQLLTKYRDGIRYMHDQTLRWLNRGLAPDEIVRQVALPPPLAECSWLGETYGTMEWSSKTVFDRYLGWFSGRVEELRPLGREERAERVVRLVDGGAEGVNTSARQALDSGDNKWALELATYVACLGPEHELSNRQHWFEAKAIRISAMKELAGKETSANGRNFFLTAAMEDAGLTTRHISDWWYVRIQGASGIEEILELMAVRVRAESVGEINKKVNITVQDKAQVFTVQLRHCVLESTACDTVPSTSDTTYDFAARAPLATWKSLIVQDMTPAEAVNDGSLVFDLGGPDDFVDFVKCFDDPCEESVSN